MPRRLDTGEEAKLLAHAGPHLQRLIIAALETGRRRAGLDARPSAVCSLTGGPQGRKPDVHDLRHEAGSRLLEAGWPLHNVAHRLGHANISQTSTYLNATRIGLQDSMRRFDDARDCNPVADETETDRAPLRNETESEMAQRLVN